MMNAETSANILVISFFC